MEKKISFNVLSLILLFLGNHFIVNYNYYFALIYSFIIIYHFYIFYFLYQERIFSKNEAKYFLINFLVMVLNLKNIIHQYFYI